MFAHLWCGALRMCFTWDISSLNVPRETAHFLKSSTWNNENRKEG